MSRFLVDVARRGSARPGHQRRSSPTPPPVDPATATPSDTGPVPSTPPTAPMPSGAAFGEGPVIDRMRSAATVDPGAGARSGAVVRADDRSPGRARQPDASTPQSAAGLAVEPTADSPSPTGGSAQVDRRATTPVSSGGVAGVDPATSFVPRTSGGADSPAGLAPPATQTAPGPGAAGPSFGHPAHRDAVVPPGTRNAASQSVGPEAPARSRGQRDPQLAARHDRQVEPGPRQAETAAPGWSMRDDPPAPDRSIVRRSPTVGKDPSVSDRRARDAELITPMEPGRADRPSLDRHSTSVSAGSPPVSAESAPPEIVPATPSSGRRRQPTGPAATPDTAPLEDPRTGHVLSDSAAEPPRGQATRAFPLLAPKAPGRSGHDPGMGLLARPVPPTAGGLEDGPQRAGTDRLPDGTPPTAELAGAQGKAPKGVAEPTEGTAQLEVRAVAGSDLAGAALPGDAVAGGATAVIPTATGQAEPDVGAPGWLRPRMDQPATPQATAGPDVQVRIGTVEVRADVPTPASPPVPSAPATVRGFGDYHRVRTYQAWGA
jgi:hypothetical protein